MGPSSAVPTKTLVDEETVLGAPQHRVKVLIEPRERDHADLFDVTVWEYDDHFQEVFTATFPGIWFEIKLDDMPSAKNLYGHRRTGLLVPEPLPIPGQRFPHERTLTTRMTAADGTICELSLWRSSTKDEQGAIILTTNQLRFSRSGTSGYTNTAVWLAPPARIG